MKVIFQCYYSMQVFHLDLEKKEISRRNKILVFIPVSLSRKLHLKNGNVDGELTETRLDEDENSSITMYCYEKKE